MTYSELQEIRESWQELLQEPIPEKWAPFFKNEMPKLFVEIHRLRTHNDNLKIDLERLQSRLNK